MATRKQTQKTARVAFTVMVTGYIEPSNVVAWKDASGKVKGYFTHNVVEAVDVETDYPEELAFTRSAGASLKEGGHIFSMRAAAPAAEKAPTKRATRGKAVKAQATAEVKSASAAGLAPEIKELFAMMTPDQQVSYLSKLANS